jgi:hypothetical protein
MGAKDNNQNQTVHDPEKRETNWIPIHSNSNRDTNGTPPFDQTDIHNPAYQRLILNPLVTTSAYNPVNLQNPASPLYAPNNPVINPSAAATPVPQTKLWRVMLEKGKASEDKLFDSKKKAEAALKAAGKKGTIAEIDFSLTQDRNQKPEETETEIKGATQVISDDAAMIKKDRYMEEIFLGKEALPPEPTKEKKELLRRKLEASGATKKQQRAYLSNLSRLNEARQKRETATGSTTEQLNEKNARFRADTEAGRASVSALNLYNKQLGNLKNAYVQAKRNGNDLKAYAIQEEMNKYTSGIPQEGGTKQRAAKEGVLSERLKYIQEEKQRLEEEKRKKQQLVATNPDAQKSNQSSFDLNTPAPTL